MRLALVFVALVSVAGSIKVQATDHNARSLVPPAPPAGEIRHSKRFFKGVELNSWRDRDRWRFSLLLGTNRLKSDAEIKAPAATLKDVVELKQRLAQLAPGESVSWEGPEFPPETIRRDIEAFCRSLGLKVLTSHRTNSAS